MKNTWIGVAFTAALVVTTGNALAAGSLTAFCVGDDCQRIEAEAGAIQVKWSVFKIYRLDAAERFSQEMTEALRALDPKDAQEGHDKASELLNSAEGQQRLADLKLALDGINRAVEWELEKLPAYVCDEQVVVYGGTLHNAHEQCIGFSAGGGVL